MLCCVTGCTVPCVQFPVYSSVCTVPSAQFCVYSSVCIVPSVQFPVYSSVCTVPSVQFCVYSSMCTVPNVPKDHTDFLLDCFTDKSTTSPKNNQDLLPSDTVQHLGTPESLKCIFNKLL